MNANPIASWSHRLWVGLICVAALVLFYQAWEGTFPVERTWQLLALLAFLAILPLAHQVSEVSAFGVTAKLQAEVKRAENALDRLRALAKVVGGAMLQDIATGYYAYDPKTVLDRLESRDRLLSLLRELGLAESDIAQADESARVWIAFWLHEAVRKIAYEDVPKDERSDFMREFDAERDFQRHIPARPEKLEMVLARYGALNPLTKGWLESYSRFLRGGEVERRQELAQVLERAEG